MEIIKLPQHLNLKQVTFPLPPPQSTQILM